MTCEDMNKAQIRIKIVDMVREIHNMQKLQNDMVHELEDLLYTLNDRLFDPEW